MKQWDSHYVTLKAISFQRVEIYDIQINIQHPLGRNMKTRTMQRGNVEGELF